MVAAHLLVSAGRPIAFICRPGNRSAHASQIAVDAGLSDVVKVNGEMGSWVGAGLPVEPKGGRIL